MGSILSGIPGTLSSVLSGVPSVLGSILSGITGTLSSVLSSVPGILGSILSSDLGVLSGILGGVFGILGSVLSRVLGGTDVVLSLGAVISSIGLHGLGGSSSVVFCKTLDLMSLPVQNLRHVLDLFVDEFLVVDVDQRRKEHDRDGDKRETPKWKEVDEPIGDQRGSESLQGVSNSSSGFMVLLTVIVFIRFSANKIL